MYSYFGNRREPRPGGNIGFDGSIIDRNRKIKGIDLLFIKQFREAYMYYINMGKTNNEAVKRLGNTCNELKQVLPHGTFKGFLKTYFPYVSMSTIERAMKIDKFIDFESYPIFKLVPQSHLLKIIKIHSFETTLDILSDNKINLNINENNTEAVGVFLGCIKLLAHGQMGFITITEEEEKTESIIDSGGWQDLQLAMDTRPDTEIEVTTAVNSTEYILNKYSVFVKTLGQCRDDMGDTLDVQTTCALISNIIAIVETLQLIGPSNLTNETRMKRPLDFFNKMLNELEFPDAEQDDTVDLNGDDYIRRKLMTLKQSSIKHTNIKAVNNSNDDLLLGDTDNSDIEEDEDLIQNFPKEKGAIEKAGSKKGSFKYDDDLDNDDDELEDDEDDEPKSKKGKSKSKSKGKSSKDDDDDDLDLDDDDLDLDDEDDEPKKKGKSKSKGKSKKVEDDDGDEDDDDLDLDDDDDVDAPPKKGKSKSKLKSKGKAKKVEDDDDDDDLDDDELEEKKKQNISKKKLTSKKSRGKFGKTSAIQDDEDLFNDIFGED